MDKDTTQYIINVLRKGTITWPGRSECLNRARVKVVSRVSKEGKTIYKYYWKCAKCLEFFRKESDMEVDHIVEVGPFNGNWSEFIPRMYCSQDNLQALCIACHMRKTQAYMNASLRYERKK